MFHACVERFDVMGERGNILGWDGEVNKAQTKKRESQVVLVEHPIQIRLCLVV
jgi:hypothetical protein